MTLTSIGAIDTSARFEAAFNRLAKDLDQKRPINRGEVHAQRVTDPAMHTRELLNVTLQIDLAPTMGAWQTQVNPNLPWAEAHFRERIGGRPLNPPPEEANWPFAQSGNAAHKKDEQFSHTYPERFWPKMANPGPADIWHSTRGVDGVPHVGIRFEYGDLDDLIAVLAQNNNSRQAYLPIWFPEDLTAAVWNERVPCSMGYHFMTDGWGNLDCVYTMRSCDLLRFFRDDLYMAGRLTQHVAECSGIIGVGQLTVHIDNLHIFEGDMPRITDMLRDYDPRAGYNFGAL